MIAACSAGSGKGDNHGFLERRTGLAMFDRRVRSILEQLFRCILRCPEEIQPCSQKRSATPSYSILSDFSEWSIFRGKADN